MKKEDPVICSFIACSCSKTPHSVDWNHQNGWIVFGSSRNVGLISPETTEKASVVAGTFREHEGDVVSVKWIKNVGQGNQDECYVVSGGTDSRAVLWKFNDVQGSLSKLSVCTGHSMTITHVCGIRFNGTILLCTCSADSTIKIWTSKISDDSNATEIQTIEIARSGLALCADMRMWNNGVVLASGHDDKKIHLFWKSDSQEVFSSVMTLSGHDDWIRGISFQPVSAANQSTSMLLSSCSQDTYVRIWRLTALIDASSGDGMNKDDPMNGSIRLKRQTFSIESTCGKFVDYSVGLEAVLAGHTDWVYSVQWDPQGKSRLLTASMDKCLILWEPDEASGLWIEKTRLGAVGGPVASGFYGGLFGPTGISVLGHTFQGGFHIWSHREDGWAPMVAPSGHYGVVEDVSWDKNGNYLLSCGADQTTRLFGPWVREQKTVTVHEIARPQVHGYDMQCIASISSSCFISGAEEKILRSFSSTRNFAENFVRITSASEQRSAALMLVLSDSSAVMAEGACVPSLGLSNKAVFAGETTKADGVAPTGIQDEEDGGETAIESATPFLPAELKEPPTEDCLMQNTLWPEVHKLYGHGCEVFAIACNHSGTVVASAAKANKPDQAQVILWSTKDWQQRGQIGGHSLTITQIAFSPDDSHLLTVSRDRTWVLHQKNKDDFDWVRIGFSDKKTAVHARIIWSCAWTPDSKFFVTVSRDKKVVVWKLTNENTGTSTGTVHQVGAVLDAPNSTTAVSVCSKQISLERYLIAVGLESGEIILYEWSSSKLLFEKLFEMDRNLAHASTVKRLQFRPPAEFDWLHPSCPDSRNIVYLASCSEDHSVKVFRIDLKMFS